MQGYETQLHMDPQAKPRYCKDRPVPYSMRTVVEQELDWLVSEGILESVKFADWASPIVPVLKANGCSVRICGVFKLLNQACKLDKYPLPKIDHLFVQVAGRIAFSKLDLVKHISRYLWQKSLVSMYLLTLIAVSFIITECHLMFHLHQEYFNL